LEVLILFVAIIVVVTSALKPWNWLNRGPLHDVLDTIEDAYGGELEKGSMSVSGMTFRGRQGEFRLMARNDDGHLQVRWTYRLRSATLDGISLSMSESNIRWRSRYELSMELDSFLRWLFAGDGQKIARYRLGTGQSRALDDLSIENGWIKIGWRYSKFDGNASRASAYIKATHRQDMAFLADVIDALSVPRERFWEARADILTEEDSFESRAMMTAAILADAGSDQVSALSHKLLHEERATLAILTLPVEYLREHGEELARERLLSLCHACSLARQGLLHTSSLLSVDADLYVALTELGKARFGPPLLEELVHDNPDAIGAGFLLVHAWNRDDDTAGELLEVSREIFSELGVEQRALFLKELARHVRAIHIDLLVSVELANAPSSLLDAWMLLVERSAEHDAEMIDRASIWKMLFELFCDSPHDRSVTRAATLLKERGTPLAIKVLNASPHRHPRLPDLLQAIVARHEDRMARGGLTLSDENAAGGLTLSEDANHGALSIAEEKSDA